MKNLPFIFVVLLLNSRLLFSQVAVNTGGNTPDSSAMLDVQSTTKGFLPPRMTTTEMASITNPATGLMVFNLDLNKPAFFNGSSWIGFDGQQINTDGAPCIGMPTVLYGGQTYNTVLIGTQCWLKENLNIGTMIPGGDYQSDNDIKEKFCYDDLPTNCDTYGGLYSWDEMMQYTTTPGVQGICPESWHVPTDAEWTTLTGYVSSIPDYWCNSNSAYIGKALADSTLWNSNTNTCTVGNNLAENNASGFSGLPGGFHDNNGSFGDVGEYGNWWTSTELSYDYAWYRYLGCYNSGVGRQDEYEEDGFSVRCLRDD